MFKIIGEIIDNAVIKLETLWLGGADYPRMTFDEYMAFQRKQEEENAKKLEEENAKKLNEDSRKDKEVIDHIEEIFTSDQKKTATNQKEIQEALNATGENNDTTLIQWLKTNQPIAPNKDRYFDQVDRIIARLSAEDISKKDAEGNTALHLAAQKKAFESVILIATKAPGTVNIPNNQGDTPLHLAALQGASNQAVINILLERNAQLTSMNERKETPLYQMIISDDPNLEIIQKMLKKACSSNTLNTLIHTGRSVIYAAVLKKDTKVLDLLVEQGFSVNERDSIEGKTPLHAAVIRLDDAMVKKLIAQGADASFAANTENEQTPLHSLTEIWISSINYQAAPEKNILENIQEFFKKNKIKPNPQKCREIATLLLKCNLHADINAQDKNGNTALHLACESSFESNNIDRSEVFLFFTDKKAHLTIKNAKGLNPLMMAIRNDIPPKLNASKLGRLLVGTQETENSYERKELIMTNTDIYGNTVAHHAAYINSTNAVNWLQYFVEKTRYQFFLFTQQNNHKHSAIKIITQLRQRSPHSDKLKEKDTLIKEKLPDSITQLTNDSNDIKDSKLTNTNILDRRLCHEELFQETPTQNNTANSILTHTLFGNSNPSSTTASSAKLPLTELTGNSEEMAAELPTDHTETDTMSERAPTTTTEEFSVISSTDNNKSYLPYRPGHG